MSSDSTAAALGLTFAVVTLILWWEQVLCSCWFFLLWELSCTDSLSHLLTGSECWIYPAGIRAIFYDVPRGSATITPSCLSFPSLDVSIQLFYVLLSYLFHLGHKIVTGLNPVNGLSLIYQSQVTNPEKDLHYTLFSQSIYKKDSFKFTRQVGYCLSNQGLASFPVHH